jgi:putative cell wall-binding protein
MLDPKAAAAAAASNVYRQSGEDRYETAARISGKIAYNRTAIITKGSDFPDALTGSALAGAVHAPILLTESDNLPDITAESLPYSLEKIYILGSEASISNTVLDQLMQVFELRDPTAPKPQVIRLGGADRYETARLIAKEVVKQGGSSTEAYLAYGGKFADAASLSSFAASRKIPVLLGDNEASTPTKRGFYHCQQHRRCSNRWLSRLSF